MVQTPTILGNTDERIPASHEDSVHISSANQIEESNCRRSALAGLQVPEPKQGEPVRMGRTGHQLAWALPLAFGPMAAHKAAVIQEKAQQLKIRRAQMAAQGEVVAQWLCSAGSLRGDQGAGRKSPVIYPTGELSCLTRGD